MVRGKRRSLTFAGALLASNVPDARESVAVLPLTEDGTTTAVIEVDKSIDTLVITTSQAGDRASRETLRARSNVAGAVFTLLDVSAPVMVISASTIVALAVTFAVTLATIFLVIITILLSILSGGLGWSRGLDGSGRSRGRLAAEGAGAPVPTLGALRRGKGTRGLVRSTAALSVVPRPVEGTVGVGGWAVGVSGSSIRKTEVLGIPPKNQGSVRSGVCQRRGTYLNWPFPHESPPARTTGRAKTRRAMRAMSDISKER